MFVLKIVTDFASAHSLRDYPGDCSRLHGHNWQVEVMVSSQVLNESGIAIDFREIKKQACVPLMKLKSCEYIMERESHFISLRIGFTLSVIVQGVEKN